MINEQTSGITSTDISFFENLIKLEEMTGFIETNKLEAGSPQVNSILTSATSVYNSINSLMPRLSEAAKSELKMGQDLYNDMLGVNAATLQDVGGEKFTSISGLITNAWQGLLSFIGIKTPEGDTSVSASTVDDQPSSQPEQPVPPSPPSEPEQPSPPIEPEGPSDAPTPRPTVRLSDTPGAMRGKSGYATRYLPKQPTRTTKTSAGPTYYVRMGPGRYQPASQTDLNSGTQLFMKNPNPALRMVYPYVKVESMIKKARRATRA